MNVENKLRDYQKEFWMYRDQTDEKKNKDILIQTGPYLLSCV